MLLLRVVSISLFYKHRTSIQYYKQSYVSFNTIQNEVNDKVKADKDVDGGKIIKQITDVIRQRFADRITALQELKRGVEEDYARTYGKSYSMATRRPTNASRFSAFRVLLDENLDPILTAQRLYSSAP